jgi:hypothetical protein
VSSVPRGPQRRSPLGVLGGGGELRRDANATIPSPRRFAMGCLLPTERFRSVGNPSLGIKSIGIELTHYPDPVGEKRYSPAICLGASKQVITGDPDPAHISTSYAERQNLTMRMHMRRFTRLTNAFSKKLENLAYQVALHKMFYNFVRVHQTLRVTSAMAAGVTTRLWEVSDIIAVIEAWEGEQATAGITYQVGENRIGGGFYVKVRARYGEAVGPIYGFKARAEAEAWIEVDRAKHRPGRRPKIAAN